MDIDRHTRLNLPISFLNIQYDLDNFSDQTYRRRTVRGEDARRLSAAVDDLRNRTVAESRLMDVDRNPRVAALPLRGVDPERRVLR